jgi:pimeloyl-ACP methyl ester carboxylesterase
LYYELAGSGRPVVFLHGLGLDHSVMKLLADRLVDEVQTLVVDLRGHGRSDWRPVRNITELADDVEALVRELGLVNPVYVGYSLGGAISLELATRTDSTVGLVLIATGLRYSAQQQAGASRSGRTRDDIQSEPGIRQRYDRFIGQPRKKTDAQVLTCVGQAMTRFIMSDPIDTLDLPALVIAGEIDTYYPKQIQEELCTRLPRSELHVIDDTTHGVIVEAPDRCESLIRDFLTRIGHIENDQTNRRRTMV